ncbi:MAG: hypothetical protein DHS20C06_15200 [Hyphobacterium sp.]|nr:MAG: hypothetical protein DHS20C06_15200 [Hyphobacterium sp.]
MSRVVNIAEFWNVYDAAVAVSALESAGIPAICPDWHLFHLKPNLLFGSTGARLWVLEPDLQQSVEILQDGFRNRKPVNICPDCGSEALHSSALSAFAFWSSLFAAGMGGGAIFAALAQRSNRVHCPDCDKRMRITPAAPFSEAELGYEPPDASLGPWLREAYRKLMSLREL